MSKLAQLGPILGESLSGAAGKLGVNIYQVMGGLIFGAGAMTMMSDGHLEICSLTGPYKFTPRSAVEEPVRPAHASPRDRLTPGVAAVCENSPLNGKTFVVFNPKMDEGFKVSALKYVPCSNEQLSKEIILLHREDLRKIARDVLVDGPTEVRTHVIAREPATPLFN